MLEKCMIQYVSWVLKEQVVSYPCFGFVMSILFIYDLTMRAAVGCSFFVL